jgi:hypothetical protein
MGQGGSHDPLCIIHDFPYNSTLNLLSKVLKRIIKAPHK